MNEAISTTEYTVAIFVHMHLLIGVGLIGEVNGVTFIKSLTDNNLVLVAAVKRAFNKFVFVFRSHATYWLPPA
jgi:hypothetical protein